ncbi:MAG: histidinol dehydrogenase, partial [Daejeonella sp.]|nr:histidinol dehydrogenase [Daejeonella sp.]
MLKVYNLKDLNAKAVEDLCKRNIDSNNHIRAAVTEIIDEVKLNGDNALKAFAEKFDGITLDKLFLDKEEIRTIASGTSEEAKQALKLAYDNIWKFHASQLKTEEKTETSKGVVCWRELRAIEKVGL